jgi:hypothetical protein
MNVEIGTKAAQFPEKEYINGIFLAVYFLSVQTGTSGLGGGGLIMCIPFKNISYIDV